MLTNQLQSRGLLLLGTNSSVWFQANCSREIVRYDLAFIICLTQYSFTTGNEYSFLDPRTIMVLMIVH